MFSYKGRVHEELVGAHIEGMNLTPDSEKQRLALAGKTVDGTQITDGLIVFTNELVAAKVALDTVDAEGWFDVVEPSGRRTMQNAERVATTFQGRVAGDEYAADAAAMSDLDLPAVGTVFVDTDNTVYRVRRIKPTLSTGKLVAVYDVMTDNGHTTRYEVPTSAVKVWPLA